MIRGTRSWISSGAGRIAPRPQRPEVQRREPTEPPRLESGLEYSKARAVRESYLARLAKIDFEERTEKLISADEVRVASFNRFRQFRGGMLNIPDRWRRCGQQKPIRDRFTSCLRPRFARRSWSSPMQTAEEVHASAAADGARPDPLLTVSDWADQYRTLSHRASAEPGPWRTERTPYLREIMDCLSRTGPGCLRLRAL